MTRKEKVKVLKRELKELKRFAIDGVYIDDENVGEKYKEAKNDLSRYERKCYNAGHELRNVSLKQIYDAYNEYCNCW